MDFSIIICTYNRCESLLKVLDDLKTLRVPENTSYEILVVDNNSRDDTRATIEAASQERPGSFKYIFEPRQGKSFALNTAVKSARGDIVAFTDDDVELDSEWLVEIKRAFDLHDCMGIGGRILAVWDSEVPWWYEEHGPYRLMGAIVRLDLGEEPCELRIPAWGANMAVRRTAFEKYGRFREDLGPNPDSRMYSGEDTEFWLRLIHGGEKLIYAPKVLVYHPVEEKRKKQNYFLSWYFNYGRAMTRIEQNPEGAIYYFGVPRYLFRQLLEGLANWIFCPNRKRRFYYKLKVYEIAGQIAESRTRSGVASS